MSSNSSDRPRKRSRNSGGRKRGTFALLVFGLCLLPFAGGYFPVLFGPHPQQALAAERVSGAAQGEPVPKIVISGNRAVSARELLEAAREDLDSLARSSNMKVNAEDAAYQMKGFYRQKGYAFAGIAFTIDRTQQGAILTFAVDEGPQVVVDTITFTGNEHFNRDRLFALFRGTGILDELPFSGKEIYVESRLTEIMAAIRFFYNRQGYVDMTISKPQLTFSPDRTRVDILFEINEGMPYRVTGLEFHGDLPDELSAGLDSLDQKFSGKPYYPRLELELRSALAELYADHGYAEVDMDIEEMRSGEQGEIVLAADILSGPRITVNSLIFRGNEQTREDFLRRNILLEPGDVFSLTRKRESFRNLYRTGLFSRLKLELAGDTDAGERPLLVDMEEYPSRELYFEAGWGSYEMLRLRGGFKEKNLQGRGRIFRTEVGGSFKGEEVTLRLTDPFFLQRRITADLPITYRVREEPSFTRKESGASFVISRDFREGLTLSLGYLYRYTSLTDIQDDTEVEESENSYNMGSISCQLSRDTRNDIFFPSSGSKIFLSEEYADGFLGSQVKFSRTTAGFRHFLPLRQTTVLGLRYDTGFILPVGDQVTLPLAERFYNGGENTVRSFHQDRLGPHDLSGDPLGGMAYNVISLEVRQNLTRNVSLSLFTDCGNVAPNRSRVEEDKPPYRSRSELVDDTLRDFFSDFRLGLGMGVQYLLPVGPARLDIAVNPDSQSGRDEREYVIHFSIGMAF